MPSHNIGLSWNRSGETISKTVVMTADGEVNVDTTVNASATDKEVDIAIDVSSLQSLYIWSDQDVTIQTNSGSVPADTLTIEADSPLVWYVGCGLDNPLGTDVTKLYLTNAGGAAATVKIRVLQDVTP